MEGLTKSLIHAAIIVDSEEDRQLSTSLVPQARRLAMESP